MNQKKVKAKSNLAAGIIGPIVLGLVLFGMIVFLVGFLSFTNTFTREYSESTYHIADTAASLVNGEHIDDYLAGKEMEEYQRTKRTMDAYCRRMAVSLIYVIKVDTSYYGRFVSVFNSVNNKVDNSSYKEWTIGYMRNTTNSEYARKYKAIYEDGAAYETVYRLRAGINYKPHITTMVPIRDESETVVALLCVQRPIHEVMMTILPYMITVLITTLIISLLASRTISSFMKRQLVVPIKKVSDEATRFARENTKGEPLGAISQYEELYRLADSIDKMETDMVNYIENLTAATAEKERIGAELSLAREIQKSAIPNIFPAYPERKEFDIYAMMKPAKEVGGDFYNFFFIDEDHLLLAIGDVSGKGIPGALFMMVTNIVLTDRSHMPGTPAEIMSFVNTHICEHNDMDMFVTIWLGILELSTGRITAANAGHEDAFICRGQGDFELFRTKHDFVVGGMPETTYTDYELQLEKGDRLFIYTDGIPEATAKDNSMFGLNRMKAALNTNKEGSPRQILEGVHDAIIEFVGDAPQFDDVTMLCFEYLPDHKEV